LFRLSRPVSAPGKQYTKCRIAEKPKYQREKKSNRQKSTKAKKEKYKNNF
jgi:hypothetical protein